MLVLVAFRDLFPDKYSPACCLLDLASVELPVVLYLNFRKQLSPNCTESIKNHGRQTGSRQCLNINQAFLNRRAVREGRACLAWPDDVLVAQ